LKKKEKQQQNYKAEKAKYTFFREFFGSCATPDKVDGLLLLKAVRKALPDLGELDGVKGLRPRNKNTLSFTASLSR